MGATWSENKMTVPKVVFRYSFVYDDAWLMAMNKKLKTNGNKESLKCSKSIQKKWDKIARNVLIRMEKISGLEWQVPYLVCYLVNCCPRAALSDPLTIEMMKDENLVIAILIHELGHVILFQNRKILPTNIDKKYGLNNKESRELVATSIQKLVYQEIFTAKTSKRYIDFYKRWDIYRKIFRIIQKEGAENIIKDEVKQWQEKNSK